MSIESAKLVQIGGAREHLEQLLQDWEAITADAWNWENGNDVLGSGLGCDLA